MSRKLIGRKMKGLEFAINSMFSLVLVMIVFAMTLAFIIAVWGGFTDVLNAFCKANPEWCDASYPPCVCCGVNFQTNPYHDPWVKDHIETINFWNTEHQCILDIDDSKHGGQIWEGVDEERCGVMAVDIVGKGFRGIFIAGKDCEVPERYQKDAGEVPYCRCCAVKETTIDDAEVWIAQWNTAYGCRDFGTGNYTYVQDELCLELWMMPDDVREDTIDRLYTFYDINRLYPKCNIPYPYNMTTQP